MKSPRRITVSTISPLVNWLIGILAAILLAVVVWAFQFKVNASQTIDCSKEEFAARQECSEELILNVPGAKRWRVAVVHKGGPAGSTLQELEVSARIMPRVDIPSGALLYGQSGVNKYLNYTTSIPLRAGDIVMYSRLEAPKKKPVRPNVVSPSVGENLDENGLPILSELDEQR